MKEAKSVAAPAKTASNGSYDGSLLYHRIAIIQAMAVISRRTLPRINFLIAPLQELKLLTNRGIGLSYPYTTRGNGKSQEKSFSPKRNPSGTPSFANSVNTKESDVPFGRYPISLIISIFGITSNSPAGHVFHLCHCNHCMV